MAKELMIDLVIRFQFHLMAVQLQLLVLIIMKMEIILVMLEFFLGMEFLGHN
mgnify:CR=1 FL=1